MLKSVSISQALSLFLCLIFVGRNKEEELLLSEKTYRSIPCELSSKNQTVLFVKIFIYFIQKRKFSKDLKSNSLIYQSVVSDRSLFSTGFRNGWA